MQFDDHLRRVRRATVGSNLLHAASFICLVASAIFWLNLYWSLLNPPIVSVPALIAISMGIVYAVVLPVLWSMLIPSTPAGMLLQRTRTRTWGFIFVVAASIYLTFHAWTVLSTWWSVQPNVHATGQERWMAIACLIAFIGIPALAWVQATPEQWVEQIRQAHLVHRLKIQHAADIAILKTTLLRAQQKTAAGIANLMPAERQELVDTLRALFEGQNETLRAIAGTFRNVADIELNFRTGNEDDLAQTFAYVADELEQTARQVKTNPDHAWELPNHQVAPHHAAPHHAAPHHAATHHAVTTVAPSSSMSHANASGRVPSVPLDAPGNARQRTPPLDPTLPYAIEYGAARTQLRPTWSVKQLAETLSIEESTARGILGVWMTAGLVDKTNLRGFYRFTAEEVK